MCPTGTTSQCGSVFSITARNRFHYQCGYSALGFFFFCCCLSLPKFYIRKIPRPSPTCLVLHARTWNWNLNYTENRSPLSTTWIDKRTYLFEFVVLSAGSVPASQIQGALLQAAKVRNRVARNGKRTTAKRNAHTHARMHAHTSLFLSLVCLSSVCFFCPSPASLVSDLAQLGTSPGLEPQVFWDSQLVWRCLQIRREAKWDLALFGGPHLVGNFICFRTSSGLGPHLVWNFICFRTSSGLGPHLVDDLNLLGTSPELGPELGHLVQLTELLWLERLKKVKKHSIFLQNFKRQLIITYYPTCSFFSFTVLTPGVFFFSILWCSWIANCP